VRETVDIRISGGFVVRLGSWQGITLPACSQGCAGGGTLYAWLVERGCVVVLEVAQGAHASGVIGAAEGI